MAINTTGYSSNQFLGLSGTKGYEKNPLARDTTDNPEFYFPGKTTPNIYDVPGSKSTNTQIQRGFIRGIFPDVVESIRNASQDTTNKELATKIRNKYTNLPDAPVRRCFFQFNPSLILRSVQASTTTLNPLLQNPNQLLQPIPGQASFEFQLLFNREHEVSAQEYITANGVLAPTKPINQSLASYGADPRVDPKGLQYAQDQLGDLGVLVDLYVLDSIIGQSITADSIDSIKAYWEATKYSRPGEELDKDGNTTQTYEDEDFLNDSDYSKNLSKVLGNSAFLNPMPIRIVFSSLFMVEGFVTASNVAFHKFSRNMVPTVCQVTLSVQALYIGFAKKDSYVTAQLTEGIKKDIKDTAEEAANVSTCKQLLNKHVQVNLVNMIYDNVYRNKIEYDGETTDTLNAWFKKVYDKDGSKFADNKEGLGFGSADGSKAAGSNNLNGSLTSNINVWTSQVYKDANLTDAQNLRIKNIRYNFYEVIKLPPECNTVAKLVEKAEKGELDNGISGGIQYQARSKVWWHKFGTLNPFDKDIGMRLINQYGGEDAPNLLEAGTRSSPESIFTWGEDIRYNGLDKDNLSNKPEKYFGDKVIVLVIVTLTAESKRARGNNTTNVVHKAAAVELDPNSQSSSAIPLLNFGVR